MKDIKVERISPVREAINGLPVPEFEIIIQMDCRDGNEESIGLHYREAQVLLKLLQNCVDDAFIERTRLKGAGVVEMGNHVETDVVTVKPMKGRG